MDPDEIKQRLAETDAKIAAKLAELGFTPEEIQRQLDPSVPNEVKQAERERVLQRKFAADLADPSSGLLDAILAKAGPEIEAEVRRLEAEKKARRQRLIVGGVIGVAVLALAVWYFALRDTRSTCEKIAGSPDEVAKLTGQRVKAGFHYSGKYSCTKTFDHEAKRASAVEISVEDRGYMSGPEASKFGEVKTASIGGRQAKLYVVATDAKEVSPEELWNDAAKRADGPKYLGKDPMGDALAALPATRHVVVVELGEKNLRATFDRAITVEQMQAYLAAVLVRL